MHLGSSSAGPQQGEQPRARDAPPSVNTPPAQSIQAPDFDHSDLKLCLRSRAGASAKAVLWVTVTCLQSALASLAAPRLTVLHLVQHAAMMRMNLAMVTALALKQVPQLVLHRWTRIISTQMYLK
jgi:uncharacterized ferritin-like protein (DUF455 family)